MKKQENNFKRGVGDCNSAGPEYQLALENTNEAQNIADAIHREFKLGVRPIVVVTRNSPKNLRGSANSGTGVIKLRRNGANVGVLLHELAHFDKVAMHVSRTSCQGFKMSRYGGMRRKSRISHGSDFKYAQTRILQYWRKTLQSKFDGSQNTYQAPKKTKEVTVAEILPKTVVKETKIPEKKIQINVEAGIQVVIDKYLKLTGFDYIRVAAIVRGFHARGIQNTPENRKAAKEYAESKNISVVGNV